MAKYGQLIGTGIGAYFGGSAGAALGGSIGAGLDGQSAQEDTNENNIMLAREQMAFQERMSSTAYQRATKDMQSAGLNPMLAFSQGGASSPSGSMAQVANPVIAGMSSANQAANTAAAFQQAAQSRAQVENMQAQTEKIRSETMDQTLNTAVTAAQLKKLEWERANIGSQRDKTMTETESLRDKLNEERGIQVGSNSAFAADVRRRKAEARLAELEVPKSQAEAKFWDDTGPLSQYLKMFMSLLSSAKSVGRFVR